ncbi:MAG: hypothetical protein WBE84_10755, partial [Xanthobacteraceae bacterium]
ALSAAARHFAEEKIIVSLIGWGTQLRSKLTIDMSGGGGGGFDESRIFSPIRSIRATIRRCGSVEKGTTIADFTGRTGFAQQL